MRTVARISLCALAGAGLIVAVAWGLGSCQRGFADELDLTGAGRQLMAEVHRQADLKICNAALLRCLASKQEVIDGLFKGGLTLQEAGDAFRRLDEEARQEEGAAAESALIDAAPLSDEAQYRTVLAWADGAALHESNGRVRLAQLQAELDNLMHQPLHAA